MLTRSDLPETLAVFPLPGAVVLPRGHLPLHLFEPRYLAMLEEALKTPHRLIGMVQPGSGPGGLQLIGCAGRITQFAETEDGRYMITLTGISRFRISRDVTGFSPYVKAEISWPDFQRDLGGEEEDPDFDREVFLKLLSRYFEVAGLETDWSSLEEADDELLINSLSMLCPFAVEEKQALLEAPQLVDRRQTLTALMDFTCRGGSSTSDEVLQ